MPKMANPLDRPAAAPVGEICQPHPLSGAKATPPKKPPGLPELAATEQPVKRRDQPIPATGRPLLIAQYPFDKRPGGT